MSMSQNSSLFVGENYGLTLNQSVQHLLAEIHKETLNLSHFTDIFYQLMQSKIDPPLESIWVYSALSFKSRKTRNDDLSSNILIAKELFQLISGCSGPCSASKSVALLGPVVFQVYELVAGLLGKDSGTKRVKKTTKEVKSLIGAILGYISVCCSKDMSKESDPNLSVSVANLVSVWMNGKDDLKAFLPFMTDEMRREISVEGTSVNYLAGVVISEAFLLKLCLDLWVGIRGIELEKELRGWIVGSITGFQSFYFFEILVRMLLEPTLPVTSLLSSEDQSFLRTILYDAVILVEYSFLSLERAVNLPADHVRSLAVKRLIITHKAIDNFRKNGDQRRAISYTSSFSTCQLPSQIIKFVASQIGMQEEATKLKGASPKVLMRWLLNLDLQGIRVFDDRISKFHAKLVLDDSMSDNEQSASKTEGKRADADLLFYIDNEGEKEDHDEDDGETNKTWNTAFVAAAHTLRMTENRGRKRKDGRRAGRNKKVKGLKDDLSDNSDSAIERSSSGSDNDSGSESEIENPISDEDA